MPIFLFVEKGGNIKEVHQPTIVAEELYKKVGFKSADGFNIQTTWNKPNEYNIQLYARKKGRAGSENKYDFPPPVDSELYFGGCILTNRDETTGEYKDLTKSDWKTIYEELFGGFEDLGGESETETETESDDDLPKTKEGYVKDGFIVEDEPDVDDDDDDDDEEAEAEVDDEVEADDETEIDDVDSDDLCEDEPDVDDDDDDEEDELDIESEDDYKPKKTAKKPAKKVTKEILPTIIKTPKSKPKPKSKPIIAIEPLNNNYLNCSDELEEEAYVV